MTFDEAGDHTQLRLRHSGFASDEDRADNEAGWGQMIGWLIADLESR